jgi:tRNA1(Val) A37 N6-methylase TrmN6
MPKTSMDLNASCLFPYSERDAAVDRLHAATAIYTKEKVIDQLLKHVNWPNSELSLFDPACGDGSFIMCALQRVSVRCNDSDSLCNMRGWEIHPQAVAEARENVSSFLVQSGWNRALAEKTAHRMITEADFLVPNADPGFYKIIAGNPPYLRFGNLPEYFKKVYGEQLPLHAKGDLLHAFLDRCRSVVTDDGKIAFVTADRWLFNYSAAALREELGRQWGINYVSRLDPETSFYRPKDRRRGSLPRIHPVEIVLANKSASQIALTKDPVYPDMEEAEEWTGRTLQDICSVSVSPWLGPIGLFVVDSEVAKALPDRYLIPCVDTDDLDYETGTIRQPSKYAIATERDERPCDSIVRHLLANIEKMPQRGLRKDGRFWVPPERIPTELSMPRLIVPRIARSLKTVVVPPGVLPINHNLSVLALNGNDLEAVRETITCAQSQRWFKSKADRLENGYFSVKTRTLRRLPI